MIKELTMEREIIIDLNCDFNSLDIEGKVMTKLDIIDSLGREDIWTKKIIVNPQNTKQILVYV